MAPVPTVGDNVRAEMVRQRRTQVELAGQLKVSQQAVSAKLAGRSPFTVEQLLTIAAWLDLPASTLLPERESVA
jgi:transcriptional regulator with XRE-family HTH domain